MDSDRMTTFRRKRNKYILIWLLLRKRTKILGELNQFQYIYKSKLIELLKDMKEGF